VSPNYTSWNDGVIAEFRANDGRTERWGDRLIVMHTVGAKSGEPRLAPVMGQPAEGGGWIVVASKGGAPDNPAWYYNLVVNPEFDIEARIGGGIQTVRVRATELTGDDRAAAWATIIAVAPGFAAYEQKTERVIPLFRLKQV
jgi:deazaflavin-dependent oxidoreductase (nitroreductase family)